MNFLKRDNPILYERNKMLIDLKNQLSRNYMKTIELNTFAALVLAVVIAGLGSILPSFFNLAGYVSGIVYLVVAVAMFTTYKKKIWYKINTVDIPQKALPGVRPVDYMDLAEKLRQMNKESN